jgi:hypothetical protein
VVDVTRRSLLGKNVRDTDLELLEVFRSPYIEDVSLSDWLTHTRPAMVVATFNMDPGPANCRRSSARLCRGRIAVREALQIWLRADSIPPPPDQQDRCMNKGRAPWGRPASLPFSRKERAYELAPQNT